jgi:hypothetical protein
MKLINFFLFLWDIFALLDPDPDCASGYGSRDLFKSGSNSDPDPQHWKKTTYFYQCSGSVTFWYESGHADPNLGLRIRIQIKLFSLATFKMPTKSKSYLPSFFFTCHLPTEDTSTSVFKNKKLLRHHKTVKNQGFPNFFCLLIKGSTSVQIIMNPDLRGTKTYGSCESTGCRPPPLPLPIATAIKNHLNEDINPPPQPTGIGERYC